MLARPAVQRVLREEGYNLATLGGHVIAETKLGSEMPG
jgi:hypothetical protein